MTAPASLAARLVSVARIWDAAPHSAFTDLLRFRGGWYCCFREGSAHAPGGGTGRSGGRSGKGRIRILFSTDGAGFATCSLLAARGIDLRDPKLSVTPDGRLMLLAGGTRFRGGRYAGRRPRVYFSGDGRRWSDPVPVLAEGDWLWRATWRRGRAYGVTYRLEGPRLWSVTLVESRNGLDYREVQRLSVPSKPNETTLRFSKTGEAIALVRREGGDKSAWIGRSRPPYTDWSWASAGARLGGPNLLFLSCGTAVVAGRTIRRGEARTSLLAFEEGALRPLLELPSGGDCGYPGLAFYRGLLWVSYYSSHEGKAAIYLARVRFSPATSRRTRTAGARGDHHRANRS